MLEKNELYTNALVNATSPYLKQHAHNPVFWYPWGPEAIRQAREDNKPIHLSIGYSSCYWCHVMEREVFENLSIASLLNRTCVNIKVDREEHPEIDEIYMVARQIMTKEGGWPNTLFLTPDLKPFYAGGVFAPDESFGKPPFPRLLEWIHYVWAAQEPDVRKVADEAVADMKKFLVFTPPEKPEAPDIPARAAELFRTLEKFHDSRAGGFFQAPKFPQESYLNFLLGYHQATGDAKALDIAVFSLRKMAAGGIYDQVGCGFHRYAIDKDWFVPHFEKMLYNQAQLARLYTDAARITGNPYLADIAKGTLDFVSGPLTSGTGAFLSAIDAETDGVEGAYYAWSAKEVKELLTPQEIAVLTTFYAVADIPHFKGHKKVEGEVLMLRKPLDDAALERRIPYIELAAICGQLMNKLLMARNRRPLPRLDDKIIVSWNGLMIDAFAYAGKVFNSPSYIARAREAVDFLLENAIDNSGQLHHIYAGGRPQFKAVLEDYAYLVKGILSVHRVMPDSALLEAAVSLMGRAEELLGDGGRGYFATEKAEDLIIRIKNCDDGALPGANAVMIHNLIDLFEITRERSYFDKAEQALHYFLAAGSRFQMEQTTLLHAALRWHRLAEGNAGKAAPAVFENEKYVLESKNAPHDAVAASVALFPADARPGDRCEVLVALDIRDGWHINAARVNQPFLIPTQVSIQNEDIELIRMDAPPPLKREGSGPGETLLVYEGLVTFTAHVRLPHGAQRKPIRVLLRYQACSEGSCYAVSDVTLSI